MSHIEHRTWFPFILVGLTIALAVVVWTGVNRQDVSSDSTSTVQQTAPSSQEYQQRVGAIVDQYLQDNDAQQAHDALLDVWVPADAKELHLDLVIAFGKLAAGDENGAVLLESLRSDNDWLP